jgi:signal peptidase II
MDERGQPMGRTNLARKATIGIALLGLALDQATKLVVWDRWGPDNVDHREPLIGSWLGIHYAENTGVAFGLLRGQTVLVTVLVIVALTIVVTAFRRQSNQTTIVVIGRALLLGGAVGNLIDRIRLGFVIDFIEVWRWPTFNVADSLITVGMLLLAWGYARLDDDTVGERERIRGRGKRGVRAHRA